MENQRINYQQMPQQGMPQIPLPNDTVIVIMGIASLIFGCCCGGMIGISVGSITLILVKNATALYNSNPSQYTASSFGNVNAGKICGIIGLILGGISLIIVIFYVAIYGLTAILVLFSSMS